MDIYKKREMRKNKKEDENKSLPSTNINWDSGAYRQLYSNH